MEEVFRFLKACGTYYLATMDGEQPRVRPFGTIDLFDGRLTIQTGRKKDVSRQILANPRVELCAFDGERWLRLAACGDSSPHSAAVASTRSLTLVVCSMGWFIQVTPPFCPTAVIPGRIWHGEKGLKPANQAENRVASLGRADNGAF